MDDNISTAHMTDIPSVSVVTLTKNRAPLLKKCLQSLVGQVSADDEIIVLDNESTDNTKEVVENCPKALNIRYYRTSANGYPLLYNLAAGKSTKDIIIFFDDDCVARKNFIRNIRLAQTSTGLSCVIQGITRSIPKSNMYAQIMGDHYKNWITANMVNKDEMYTLDNKNASMPRYIFLKSGGFCPQLTRGSEDTEFGIRLRQQGVSIKLNTHIIAYHHERSTLWGFLKQHARMAKSESFLHQYLQDKDIIGSLRRKRIVLNAASAMAREVNYIKQKNITFAINLPIAYLLLVCVHVYGKWFSN